MTSPSWHDANLDLRRRRDEMNAAKKRQEQERQSQAAAHFAGRESCSGCACHSNVAYCLHEDCPRGLNL